MGDNLSKLFISFCLHSLKHPAVFVKLDPDPHRGKQLDPDPHKLNGYLHWWAVALFLTCQLFSIVVLLLVPVWVISSAKMIPYV